MIRLLKLMYMFRSSCTTIQMGNFVTREQEKRRRVLVVDDEPRVLKFVAIALRLRGFEVVSTTSGEEALELIKSAEPDIVLLDVIMPGIDGFEVLEKLRTFTELPVIIFSASPENRDNAMRLGTNYFMLKPFNLDEMEGRIKAIL
jgi:two-component system KDP operon response regulator KdpE